MCSIRSRFTLEYRHVDGSSVRNAAENDAHNVCVYTSGRPVCTIDPCQLRHPRCLNLRRKQKGRATKSDKKGSVGTGRKWITLMAMFSACGNDFVPFHL